MISVICVCIVFCMYVYIYMYNTYRYMYYSCGRLDEFGGVIGAKTQCSGRGDPKQLQPENDCILQMCSSSPNMLWAVVPPAFLVALRCRVIVDRRLRRELQNGQNGHAFQSAR